MKWQLIESEFLVGRSKSIKMNKTLKKALILFGIIFGFLFYYYPLQRIGAEIKFWQYTKEQGLQKESIISKRTIKDYKMDGYIFIVDVKDDEKHTYEYRYWPIKKNRWKGIRKFDMTCAIFDETNFELDEYADVLYPPLE